MNYSAGVATDRALDPRMVVLTCNEREVPVSRSAIREEQQDDRA
jgi:hypothetical protein